MNDINSYFMSEALKLANISFNLNEVPVGCVIVFENKIIGKGYNQVEKKSNSILHAEMIAIQKAIDYIGYKHLLNCKLFVTLEPCTMCAGAIILSRIPFIYIGTLDPKSGASKSVFNILESDELNHKPIVEYGLNKEQSSSLLKDFFKNIRAEKKRTQSI